MRLNRTFSITTRGIATHLGALIIGISLGASPASNADHATSPAPGEPYGGCDEAWQAPKSEGAAWCRRHGWTVRPNFVIDKHNVLRTTRFGACENEDSTGCYWNAMTRGNHIGDSYIVSKSGEVFYVSLTTNHS